MSSLASSLCLMGSLHLGILVRLKQRQVQIISAVEAKSGPDVLEEPFGQMFLLRQASQK